jgi:hypothetical protein
MKEYTDHEDDVPDLDEYLANNAPAESLLRTLADTMQNRIIEGREKTSSTFTVRGTKCQRQNRHIG